MSKTLLGFYDTVRERVLWQSMKDADTGSRQHSIWIGTQFRKLCMRLFVTLSVENFDSLQGLDTNIRTISLQ